jgi:hypothetical protein
MSLSLRLPAQEGAMHDEYVSIFLSMLIYVGCYRGLRIRPCAAEFRWRTMVPRKDPIRFFAEYPTGKLQRSGT